MGMCEKPSAISHQPSGKTFGGHGRDQGTRIAIVAAMKKEIAPLVRGWSARKIVHEGRTFEIFETGDAGGYRAIAICGGIGAEAARRAAEAVVREAEPARVVSVGFAGALDSKMKIGDVIEARVVVNASDGSRTDTGSGQGTLLSCWAVADRDQKKRLAAAYRADAVDMEAAAVAQAAQAHGLEFAALKAISDAVDFSMPPVHRFVSGDGRFRSASFALHVAVRPWLWKRTITLARNSERAIRALCVAIVKYLNRRTVAVELSHVVAGR